MEKPRVIKSILCSILMFLVFLITYIVVFLLFALLIYLLSLIPIVSSLLNRFFDFRGDSPDMVAPLLSASLGYVLSNYIIEAIHKHDSDSTLSLTRKITGIVITALWGLSLIINIIFWNGIYSLYLNGVIIAHGIAFIVKRDTRDHF